MERVSVIMPAHNNERDISLAIASVLAQDYHHLELIVVNDASTDATLEIVQQFAAQDDRLILLNNEHNLGRARSRNRAIEAARSDLIAILDADDIAMPYRLSRQVAHMEDHPEVGMLGAWAVAIDGCNQPLEPMLKPTTDADIRWRLRSLNMPFIHSSVMFRRDLLLAAGMYDARFPASQDFHLCGRLIQQGKAASLAEFLILYRVHTDASPEFVRARYKWAAYAGWDLFKRQPTFLGVLSLARMFMLSRLPGFIPSRFLGVYKDKWDQTLLSQAQIAEMQRWIADLQKQFQ